ncbi:hypothetical protein AYI68_g133 [Smittium mucronatum]|uniref:Uncharacterized protein n=1 Tax=Smittium mucronatum TaxID=133383 RepID=A0A1R0H962_9FUNG|nr:hypothetical protein AYI68_g133 [Smittium mucronatum]
MSSDTQVMKIDLAIKALTAKVDNLILERIIINIAEKYPHISINSPVAVFIVHPELEKLIKSISDDFYRTMFAEKKRDEIYACSKGGKIS